MLGQFDEYVGGGTDPSGVIIDSSSIMGSTEFFAVTYARHYEDFRAWLAGKDTEGQYSLVQHASTAPRSPSQRRSRLSESQSRASPSAAASAPHSHTRREEKESPAPAGLFISEPPAPEPLPVYCPT
jgi:hypothetical protein